MISREDVLEIAYNFPKSYAQLRKQAVRMAVRRQFILAAKLIMAQQGREWGGSKNSVSSTLDRMFEDATSVPMAEMRLQGVLTSNRLAMGPNAALIRGSTARDMLDEGDDEEEGGSGVSDQVTKIGRGCNEQVPASDMGEGSSVQSSMERSPEMQPVRTSYGATKPRGTGMLKRGNTQSLSAGLSVSAASPVVYNGKTVRSEIDQVGQLLQARHAAASPSASLLAGTRGVRFSGEGDSGVVQLMSEMRQEMGSEVARVSTQVAAIEKQLDAVQGVLNELLHRLPPPAPS